MPTITGNFNFPTAAQNPSQSIMDINGKQTYLGNTFILPINGFTIDSTDEDPVALITNPLGNTKSLFLFSRSAAADGPAVIRYYFNPTISANGDSTTPVNLRPASSNTSVSACYLTPTISNNGTFFSVVGTQVTIEVSENNLFILDPGQSMLITTQSPSWSMGNDVLVYSENIWFEL